MDLRTAVKQVLVRSKIISIDEEFVRITRPVVEGIGQFNNITLIALWLGYLIGQKSKEVE